MGKVSVWVVREVSVWECVRENFVFFCLCSTSAKPQQNSQQTTRKRGRGGGGRRCGGRGGVGGVPGLLGS